MEKGGCDGEGHAGTMEKGHRCWRRRTRDCALRNMCTVLIQVVPKSV
jgi:hypothetical protein